MHRSIVFFDDICVLCSRSVALILRNDPKGKFAFASIGSEIYQQKLKELKLDARDLPDSIILLHKSKIYTRSTAALRIAAVLRFPWPLFAIFYLVPRFLRNPFYDLVARKRYQWFGKREECFVPDDGDRDRML